MVNEDNLSAVLSEFARTMVTDFPVQGILDRLVGRIVDVLPVSAAAVTLISESLQPHYVAASNESALRFERAQSAMGEGPCLAAYTSGEPALIPDLLVETRFPQFVPAALAGGLRAMFTFPLRHGEGRVGALDLYSDRPGTLDARDIAAAQTLADVAAAYLLNAQARDQARIATDLFQHHALHDPLTGLPNRVLLRERLEHAAERAKRSRSNAALLFADIDRFKLINDTYGHQAGDELLVAVAERLGGLVRSGDTLARVGGDEFMFLCEDLRNPTDVDILVSRINEMFAHPFSIATIEVLITASVGKAFAGPGEEISSELLDWADTSMYQEERMTDGTAVPASTRRVNGFSGGDLRLESRLRSALADNLLEVAYQPIVQSADGRITAVEALLRWFGPQRTPVSPTTMIKVAEQTTLIHDIGAWILERSCRAHAGWSTENPDVAIDLAVNVSARQLTDPGFVTLVDNVLTRTRMAPTDLVLEVTESIFIDDDGSAVSTLEQLRKRGIRLALDDFGTGYSSLRYLSRLPVQIIKIDRNFIAAANGPSPERLIAAAITDLAHTLGLAVVAEGVEHACEHEAINEMGCDYAQGYFYGRPQPAEAISERLGLLVVADARAKRHQQSAAAVR